MADFSFGQALWYALFHSVSAFCNAGFSLFSDSLVRYQEDVVVNATIMVLIGLAWIPVIQGGKGLYDYLQGVQAYLAPPIFVVFFLGVFVKRLNAKGALWALIVGFALGLFRLAIETPVKLMDDFAYREGSFFWIVSNTPGPRPTRPPSPPPPSPSAPGW